MLCHCGLLRIDGGLGTVRSIQSHRFLSMVGIVVYYTYYERVYFSLFDNIFLFQIDN